MTDLKTLEQDLKNGRLSRRDFLKAASMFGFAAAAPSILMGTAHASMPQKGGHLTFGLGHGSTTDSLDPGTWENAYIQVLGKSVFNYLTVVKADGGVYGEIAESWESAPGAQVWTFTLRKNLEFHDGKKLTAKDVIASLNHHRGDESKSGAKSIVSGISEMKAQDDHTLVITLSTGNADFPFQLSDYHLAILADSGDGKIDAKSGIGSGAYTVKNYEPGVSATLEKFAGYWDDSEGHADSIELITIADVAARTNALTTGEIDVADRMDVKTLHLLARNKKIKILETSGNAHYSMPMRCTSDPYSNNDIRLALKYSLDREALLQNVLRGHGYVGNDHPIGRANRYLHTDLPQRAYDPEKAKFHLKKAGVDKLKIELSASDAAFAGAVDAAVLYREQAAKAGIDVKVIREPNDGYWSNVWMKKDYCMCYWGGRATEDWMFSAAYAAESEWNDAYWQHEKFNKILVEARSELDEAKRAEMYAEMQTIVSDEGGTAIPIFNNYIFASTQEVEQPEQMGNDWAMDGLRAPLRWWKES